MKKERFLPDNSRPSYTGQGLTEKQKSFFHVPRTMKEIAEDLFKGDYWAANHFQNKFIYNSVLEITTSTELHSKILIGLIDWKN